MASLDFKVELDSADLDVALEKAERLKATLEKIKALQAEIAVPAVDGISEIVVQVAREIALGARSSEHRFKP